MDYTLIHTNQPGMIAVEVRFDRGPKTYIYKSLLSDNIRQNDKVLVQVEDEMKIVTVLCVHTEPLAVLEPDRAYRWIVQRIDTFTHTEREYRQSQMIEQLRVWESQRKILEAAETQRKMLVGLPGVEKFLRAFQAAWFASCGSSTVNIHKWLRGHTTRDSFGTLSLTVDADVIGYHWTVAVCGKTVSQGRCWKFVDACLAARTAFNYRKCLDQHGPGVEREFNFRKWFCDFTRMP